MSAALNADLSALVSARLCHDLISPMGAIGNGLELMQLSQLTTSAEVELIAGSLGSAIAKLRFFRIAFGPAEAQASLSGEEIRAVTDAMFPGRFGVSWVGPNADLGRATGKLVCLALLCLEKSLPMGGTAVISVETSPQAGAIEIVAQGRRLAPPADLWALAAGATPGPLRSDGVQFALLGAALSEFGADLETSFDEPRAEVRITPRRPA